jgi:hypothetical protein
MFQAIRRHLSYANVAATVALVFAVTGGAFAATGHSGGPGPASAHLTAAAVRSTFATSAKSKSKPKTGPRGPAGPKGATGAAGPAGAIGTAGPAGPTGATGPAGSGSAGPQGLQGAQGPQGEKGLQGEPGEAAKGGEFPATLPEGKTETGTWSIDATDFKTDEIAQAAISFPIPLPAASTKAFFFTEAETKEIEAGKALQGSKCTGTLEKPKAPLGTLCVFTRALGGEGSKFSQIGLLPLGGASYSPTGTLLFFEGTGGRGSFEEPTDVIGNGSWAVTAPVE